MTTTAPTLTHTQTAALADLRRLGHLWPADRTSTGAGTHARYSRSTLNALVTAGVAAWAPIRLGGGVMPHIVPTATDDNLSTERPCARCGDECLTLSSADLCDGCEAEPAHPTRFLIVTLPNTSGEEADEVAAHTENDLRGNLSGMFAIDDADVSHALGETVLAGGMRAVRVGVLGTVDQRIDVSVRRDITPDEARQLAGALLTLAHDIDGK